MQRIDLAAGGATAFSTLRGADACSGDAYSGFNACHYTGDDATHVAACREELAAELGVSVDRLVIPRQTHSAKVAVVKEMPVSVDVLEGVDALVTRMRDVALCINTADCVPVVMHDPDAGVIAAAHCGWRGIVNELLANTLGAMTELGAESGRIRAAMGTSICAGCFEVGEEVAQRFREAFGGEDGIVIEKSGVRPHVDLGRAIRAKLLKAGLQPENVSLPSECSRCNPQRFFSARAMGIASGRTLTVLML